MLINTIKEIINHATKLMNIYYNLLEIIAKPITFYDQIDIKSEIDYKIPQNKYIILYATIIVIGTSKSLLSIAFVTTLTFSKKTARTF